MNRFLTFVTVASLTIVLLAVSAAWEAINVSSHYYAASSDLPFLPIEPQQTGPAEDTEASDSYTDAIKCLEGEEALAAIGGKELVLDGLFRLGDKIQASAHLVTNPNEFTPSICVTLNSFQIPQKIKVVGGQIVAAD